MGIFIYLISLLQLWQVSCPPYRAFVCQQSLYIDRITDTCKVEVVSTKDTKVHYKVVNYEVVTLTCKYPVQAIIVPGNRITQFVIDFIHSKPKGTVFIFFNIHFYDHGKLEEITGPSYKSE